MIVNYNTEECRRFCTDILETDIVTYADFDQQSNVGFVIYICETKDSYRICYFDNRTNNQVCQANQECIAKLDLKQEYPLFGIDKDEKIAYFKMLATGYSQVMKGETQDIDAIIEKCVRYAQGKKYRKNRCISTLTAGVAALIALAFFSYQIVFGGTRELFNGCNCTSTIGLIWCLLAGVLGSFVSIWHNYEKRENINFGKNYYIVAETICRLLLGALLALVAYYLLQIKVIFGTLTLTNALYFIVGFVAGMCEYWIMGVAEKFIRDSK